jgi:hypothetical protein
MWTTIKDVGTWITLIAFICAVAAWLYRTYLLQRERLIKSVPEDKRARLVEQTYVLFKVSTAKLSREQQYNLALKQISEQARKVQLTAGVIALISVLAAALTFVAIPRLIPSPSPPPAPTPTPDSLSGKIEQVEVIQNPGGGAQAFILLSIENTGTPTGIQKYSILINHVTKKSFQYNGPLEGEIKRSHTLPQAGGKKAVTIDPQDSIVSQIGEAIRPGRKVSGWLRLELPDPDLKPEVLLQAGTLYKISFADSTGKIYQDVYEMK